MQELDHAETDEHSHEEVDEVPHLEHLVELDRSRRTVHLHHHRRFQVVNDEKDYGGYRHDQRRDVKDVPEFEEISLPLSGDVLDLSDEEIYGVDDKNQLQDQSKDVHSADVVVELIACY